MKEYFSHDYNARNDQKLVKMQMKLGLAGIGCYWCIVEMLYEESGYILRTEYERIAFELRTEYELVKSVINDFDLFQFDEDKFWSESALNRILQRAEKSDKARESVSKRWNKYERNTNVLKTKYESDTNKVKESKIKETKENESISDWRNDFEIYKSDLRKVYQDLINDSEFIQNQEKYHPGVEIALSLEKACVNFWATEAGWKHKKKSRSKEIDWKSTLINAIDMNKVYKATKKDAVNEKGETYFQMLDRIAKGE